MHLLLSASIRFLPLNGIEEASLKSATNQLFGMKAMLVLQLRRKQKAQEIDSQL